MAILQGRREVNQIIQTRHQGRIFVAIHFEEGKRAVRDEGKLGMDLIVRGLVSRSRRLRTGQPTLRSGEQSETEDHQRGRQSRQAVGPALMGDNQQEQEVAHHKSGKRVARIEGYVPGH